MGSFVFEVGSRNTSILNDFISFLVVQIFLHKHSTLLANFDFEQKSALSHCVFLRMISGVYVNH